MHYQKPSKKDITYIGRVDFRNNRTMFGIKQGDRLLHTYLIGKTGTGKTSLLETMLMQDLKSGRGLCLLDPHGDFAEKVVQQIPKSRKRDFIYFNIPDSNLSLGYNPLRKVSYEKRSLVASGIMEAFEKLWRTAWGVKLEHILRNTLLSLLDQPSATLSDVPEFLLDDSYRKKAIKHIENESVRKFWEREFPKYNRNDLLPVLNKIGALLAHPIIKKVFVENRKVVSIRRAMDEGKVLLVNLSKGHLGSDVSQILGAMFITSIGSAAFSRANIPESSRRPFMVYLDEFHNFTTLSLVNMFSELRKFKVGLTLAHQYLHQLDDKIRHAILGNIGTLISFRIGTNDASYLSREMYPEFNIEDFIHLPNYHIYLKLMVNGKPSRPFSAVTLRR